MLSESSLSDYLAIQMDAHMEQGKSMDSRVVDRMCGSDAFSQWLGIERLQDGPGSSVLRMTVRAEMLNGFAIAHGAIAYALADSALAFAANGHGVKSVSIETSISHTRPVLDGDVLTATARELNLTARFGIYEVKVEDGKGRTVALFKGTVFRTGETWDV
jgi:acyl-CoA thioesterase